jgi:hypothetical protein
MMVEARFPNVNVAQLAQQSLNRSASWQPTGKGSVYGRIFDPALAATNFSWNGALATLQIAHQFFTWTVSGERASCGLKAGMGRRGVWKGKKQTTGGIQSTHNSLPHPRSNRFPHAPA